MFQGKFNSREIALHLVVWGIIFSFPLLFGELPASFSEYLKIWRPLFFSGLIFYINYLYLVNLLVFRHRITLFVLINLVLILFCLLCMEWLIDLSQLTPEQLEHFRRKHNFIIVKNILSFLLAAGISVALSLTHKWLKAETERKSAETENLKSELTHLQYQIQPHFFFNALNNIYALVDISPERSKESIHGLSKLMRYLLYETKADRVPLAKEIEFIRKFIQLTEMRLPAHIRVTSVFDEHYQGLEIAPLLFIPLVENAFKHGVSATQASTILIIFTVSGTQVSLRVENTNFPKAHDADLEQSGIGLTNLKKRLELIYPGRFELVQEIRQGIFFSELKIDIG